MLVIRRRVGESIVINGEITIEVTEVSRTRVRIGVCAPKHVSVVRSETLVVAQENRLASGLVGIQCPGGVSEVLRLVHLCSADPAQGPDRNPPQSPASPADMYFGNDTAGITRTVRTHPLA